LVHFWRKIDGDATLQDRSPCCWLERGEVTQQRQQKRTFLSDNIQLVFGMGTDAPPF
jgi:hypothetical protein